MSLYLISAAKNDVVGQLQLTLQILVPAAAVIPAPIEHIKVVAVKKLVVGSRVQARGSLLYFTRIEQSNITEDKIKLP